MFQIYFYVPETHAEQVKAAVFAAGGGRIGAYEHCAWQSKGQGQFRPLQGSDPFIGMQGQLERVDEIKVEFVCTAQKLKAVLQALVAAHPYETPAYGACKITTLENMNEAQP